MFAVVILGYISEIASAIYGDEALSQEARALAAEVRAAIERYAVVPTVGEPFYAFEVDGFGQYLVMDDGNIPSLLSMPLIGYCAKDDPLYLRTRRMILSEQNPYYYTGSCLRGVGSPHTPPRYVWDLALAVQGLTAQTRRNSLP